jgi:hypothetical protein
VNRSCSAFKFDLNWFAKYKKFGIEKVFFFIKGHGPNPASTLKLAHQAEALPGIAAAHWLA